MVENSETNDIEPALALGMRAIRMSVKESPPVATAAHAVVTSLHATLELMRQWMSADDDRPKDTLGDGPPIDSIHQ